MSFFEELKRRNVIKVMIAYIVMAWLVMQVADVILNNVDAPGWVFFVILLLLGIGFVFALFFSWAFELTPEGVKREREVDRTQSITHKTGRKLDFAIIGILLLAVGYFSYDKFVLSGEPEANPITTSPEAEALQPVAQAEEADNSIAVLPFADMSPDKDQEYFSDGLSEELLNLLAKIPELRVAARTSAFSYKGKDVKISQVGEELGVAHVLEGSVRTAGSRIRVTAQLIKADDGFHLWSETYDRTMNDVFAIQDEISAAVVAALKLTILGESLHVTEIDPEAYALYLQGRHLSNQLTPANFSKAVALYKQVIEIEPDYAPAWVGLSRNYRNMVVVGQLEAIEGNQMALAANETALRMNPDLAEAHARMGLIIMDRNETPETAAGYFRRAMELNPNDPSALQGVANFALFLDETNVAVEIGEAAVLRDPVDALLRLNMGDYYVAAGRTEDAISTYKNALNLNPDINAAHYKLGVVYLRNNQPEAAFEEFNQSSDAEYKLKGRALFFHAVNRKDEFEAAFTQLRNEYGEQWPSEIAHVYAWIGDTEAAFEWLDKAIAINEGGINASRQQKLLEPLHDDPRWQVYLEAIGISDKQVAGIEFKF